MMFIFMAGPDPGDHHDLSIVLVYSFQFVNILTHILFELHDGKLIFTFIV